MQFTKFILVIFTLLSFLRCDTPRNFNGTNFVSSTPATNIIFIVGDGMGLSQITAGMYEMGNQTVLEEFPIVGLIKTHAVGNMITDSAAGATAFATGKKTRNGRISMSPDGAPLQTIFEKLSDEYTTGLAVTSTITHATPACYYAHSDRRSKYPEIAEAFSRSSVDVAIGFGREQFTDRADGQDLLVQMKENGILVLDTLDEELLQRRAESRNKSGSEKRAENQGGTSSKRLAVLLPGEPRGVSARPPDYLNQASQLAITELDNSSKPFFLMVEASQIDWAGHANQKNWMMEEMKDFDKTVRGILDFARTDRNTLVVITADHETGGLAINAGDFAQGTMEVAWTTGGHTGTMVPVFAYGPGAENFAGIYDNTAIFHKLLTSIGK